MSGEQDRKQAIIDYIETLTDEFDQSAQDSANHAFNLGCWVGLAPVFLIVALVFYLTKWNWVAATIIAALLLIALLGSANLVASIALNNAIKRNFKDNILPEIAQKLIEFDIDRPAFDQIADEIIPTGSMLRKFIPDPPNLPTDIANEFYEDIS